MSLQAITFDEMQEKNAFIENDLKRVNTKASNLKETLQEYIKEKKENFQDIQDSLHAINNQIVFSDDDLRQLLDIEKDIDKLILEIQEKQ